MNSILPCEENNAIKEVAFVIELNRELGVDTVTNFIKLHSDNYKGLKEELPGLEKLHNINISAEEGSASKRLEGITMAKYKTDGSVIWSATVRGRFLIVKCGKYDSWTKEWNQAKKYFQIIIDEIESEHIRWRSVTLEYIDEFYVNNSYENWMTELFNSDCHYLPPSIYALDDTLWHCNQGWFSKIDNQSKNLNNIDVSKLYLDSKLLVRIRTAHSTKLDSELKIQDMSNIEEYMKENHSLNKGIFKKMLSQSIKDKINLE